MAAVEVASPERVRWRAVAVPAEHGGWGLTAEPVLLGLLVAPSIAGGAIGLATVLAFLVRTPLKLAAVDRRRHRWLARSALAARVAAVELVLLATLVAVASARGGARWLVPGALATPLVAVELWFDVRSRSRRLVPELAGAAGVAASVAAIALAGGRSGALAAALWLVLVARSLGALPFVRAQIFRLRQGGARRGASDAAQVVAIAVGAIAVALDRRAATGLGGLAVLAVLQAAWIRRPVPPVKALGLRELALGIGLVAVTAAGVLAG
jgi:hypothetical protein